MKNFNGRIFEAFLLAALFAAPVAELIGEIRIPPGLFGIGCRSLYILTLVVLFLGVRAISQKRKKIDFSFTDIEKIFKKELDPKTISKKFNPDLIVGIGGDEYVGGPVIASLLSSQRLGLNKKCLYLELSRRARKEGEIEVYWETAQSNLIEAVARIEKFHIPRESKKISILLVDDFSQNGNTLYETIKRLKDNFDEKSIALEIRMALIAVKAEAFNKLQLEFKQLSEDTRWDGLYKNDFWKEQFRGYDPIIEDQIEVIFPWKT